MIIMATIFAAEALSGKDNFCMNYLKAFRAGCLKDNNVSWIAGGQFHRPLKNILTGAKK